MGEALLWGAVAGSSLVIGALAAYVLELSDRAIGLLLAFGAGTLISAVSFELVSDAFDLAGGQEVWLGLAAGALAFYLGKRALGPSSEGAGQSKAIVLGTVLDGIPEGIVLGMSLIGGGGGSAAVIGAVFMSNIPEATSSTNELKASFTKGRMFVMWGGIALATTLSAMLGYAAFDTASNGVVAFTQAFAGGALLAMLSSTMIPDAHEKGNDAVGLVTVLGFAVAFALAELA
ncbi:MAG: ZIP family metal transporter [Solirubrobacterales bacterium]